MPGPTIAPILIALIGLQHLAFAYLEMFLWAKPIGRKIFKTDEEFAKKSRVLAANQGLYNIFLAAGLLLSFFLNAEAAHYFRFFFLSCVAVAGIFGGFTVSMRLAMVQAGPALLA
ncbi:MAG: DUF1304 domain-containing protein, partial [Proteobacteria bacterium]